jgi:hypothetical protein
LSMKRTSGFVLKKNRRKKDAEKLAGDFGKLAGDFDKNGFQNIKKNS